MGDFIYPECPECGSVPEDGFGVSLHELPYFDWVCRECYTEFMGFWAKDVGQVEWAGSRELTGLTYLRYRLETAAKRYLKHKTG